VAAPNKQAGKASREASAGRVRADGTRVYRLAGPQVIWWTWVGVVLLGVGDLVFSGRNWISLKVAFGLLAATGLVYACALWPRVVADDDGISVVNPIRRFRIPWAAVKGIFLADSVEVQCARPPKPDKTVYSWALASPRRARARAQMRSRQWDSGAQVGAGRARSRGWGGGFNTRPSGYDRLPESAKAVARLTPAEVMARELGQLSEEARARSAAGVASANGHAAGPAYGLDAALEAAAGRGVARQDPAQDTHVPAVAPELTGAGNGAAQARLAGQDGSRQDADGQAQAGGDGAAAMSARWSWPALAAVLVPAAGLIATIFVH
jgi:Bacterial PH domain